MKHRILVVDDDKAMGDVIAEGLTQYDVETCTSGTEALQRTADVDFAVVVTDLRMRGMGGIELCERLSANRPDVPVVVITAFGSYEAALQAIRAGAYDFLPKPFELEALAHTLERAIQHRALREEVRRLRTIAASADAGNMLGSSAPMARVRDLVARVAATDVSVLITGESGTGKEVAARAIHDAGPRREGPFVAVSCAAMPEALLESELFGHARGAFTDAKTARSGLFVEASGGTLFLDEIGDMPLALQPKLLRALQERRARPVGGTAEVAFDVRVIAATNVDLEAAIEEGRFREDLYYRINVVHMQLPPLRARSSDVLLLAQHFLERAARRMHKKVEGISPPAAERLLDYAWPGNVRELQNCVERAVALTAFDQITVADLPDKIQRWKVKRTPQNEDDPAEILPLDAIERRHILRVLDAAGGNKTLAAQLLGIDRKTLHRKLERYS